jgi:hypothetical protein
LEEAYVVLREQTKVFNSVLEIGDSLYSKTEGIARINLRINTARLQYVRINHTASQDLYPASTLTERTTLATAKVTRDVHLSRWFSEWEVTRAKANLCLWTKHLLGKIEQNLFEISKADVLVNIESLYLVEEAVRTC